MNFNVRCSSIMLRFFKYFFVVTCVVCSLTLLIAVISYCFPPKYEATAKFPDSASQIIIQLEPMHPYLAEYRRTLVLRKNGALDQHVEMFPDSGGYSRTQLYRLPGGLFLLRGFFDSFKIDLANSSFVADSETGAIVGTYLGAFDDTDDGKWLFIDASHSPEQPLVAGGG